MRDAKNIINRCPKEMMVEIPVFVLLSLCLFFRVLPKISCYVKRIMGRLMFCVVLPIFLILIYILLIIILVVYFCHFPPF